MVTRSIPTSAHLRLPSNILGVLLDPAVIVETMHDAYRIIDLTACPYGVFMTGSSRLRKRSRHRLSPTPLRLQD